MIMKTRWIVLTLFLMGIFTVVASVVFVFLWGTYRQHWDGRIVQNVAEKLPVPAARVGSEKVLLRSYFADVASLSTYLVSDEVKQLGVTSTVGVSEKRQVFERLIREAAVQELAKARSIRVTEEELNTAIEQEFSVTSDQKGFEEYLQKTFGWSFDSFKQRLAEPILLERKVSASYSADHPGDDGAFEAYIQNRIRKDDVVRYLSF